MNWPNIISHFTTEQFDFSQSWYRTTAIWTSAYTSDCQIASN